MRKISIRAEKCGVEAVAELNDTKSADAVWEKLPIESEAQRWGDEVYFSIPVKAKPEKPQAKVPFGTIAYWPPGSAFCIFFGQTPYSPVNVLGRIEGDAMAFAAVEEGEKIRLERPE